MVTTLFISYQWRKLLSDVFQDYVDNRIRHLPDSEIDDFRNQAQALLNDLYTAENMDFTPVGTVAWFPSPIANLPEKWLLCNNTAYLQTDYPDLYNILVDFQFVDGGINKFRVPALTDKFLWGATVDAHIGDVGGEIEHTLTIAEMPAHNHVQRSQPTGGAIAAIASTANRLATINNTVPTTGDTGGDGAHNNMPPYMRGYWMIKALP